MTFTSKANSNIALIKYWGKRNHKLNLPAVGSISVTLDSLHTTTTVEIVDNNNDIIFINGAPAREKEFDRITQFLDLVRKSYNIKSYFNISTSNNFPLGAGLASSASGFAALAHGVVNAAGINLSNKELSILARQGSGSAARSVFGGFVEMKLGGNGDSDLDFAEQIAPKSHWDLSVVILVTSGVEKKISSTNGMNMTAYSSPYYNAWISSSNSDIYEAKKAIAQKDFEKLADVTEFSTLKMHALAMSARPGLIYWNGTTLELINEVRELRADGVPVFFTVDAGPQVKIICPSDEKEKIKKHFVNRNGIEKIIVSDLGDGVKKID